MISRGKLFSRSRVKSSSKVNLESKCNFKKLPRRLHSIFSVPHLFLPGGLLKSSFKNKISRPVFRPAGGFL